MAFIKRHLMLLACGALGVLSMVALILGVLIGSVSGQMQEAESLYKRMSSMTRDGVNDEHIRQAQEKAKKLAADFERVRGFIRTLNARKPLREHVFPAPRKQSDAYAFREAYREAIDRLLPEVLKAKSPPTADEYRRMGLLIAKEKADAARSTGPQGGAPGQPPATGAPGSLSRVRCRDDCLGRADPPPRQRHSRVSRRPHQRLRNSHGPIPRCG